MSSKIITKIIFGKNSKIVLNLPVDEKLSEYFNNSFTNEIQKSEKIKNNIYYDTYSLSKFFKENEINKINYYIHEQEL